MADFPRNLLIQYKSATNKLRKFQRVVFKRFAPNVSEVSQEFQQLAVQFSNANLPEYTALCYLAASKCERALNNTLSEVHFLLRSARAFIEANRMTDRLHLRSNASEYINGALNCYNQAISMLDEDSVMKAAIIREMKEIHTNCELASNFASPTHRMYDLEAAANDCIRTGDYSGALDKLTEIHDDVCERKVQHFHGEMIRRNEVSRILLLLLLRLPPARQAPSNVKLLQKFCSKYRTQPTDAAAREPLSDVNVEDEGEHSSLVSDALGTLITACRDDSDASSTLSIIQFFETIPGLTLFQQIVLKELKAIYQRQ